MRQAGVPAGPGASPAGRSTASPYTGESVIDGRITINPVSPGTVVIDGFALVKSDSPVYMNGSLSTTIRNNIIIANGALFGATTGVKCGLDFFGPSKIVFATDAPLGPIRKTYDGIAAMDLDPASREAIFYGNAAKLLRL